MLFNLLSHPSQRIGRFASTFSVDFEKDMRQMSFRSLLNLPDDLFRALLLSMFSPEFGDVRDFFSLHTVKHVVDIKAIPKSRFARPNMKFILGANMF